MFREIAENVPRDCRKCSERFLGKVQTFLPVSLGQVVELSTDKKKGRSYYEIWNLLESITFAKMLLHPVFR